MLFLPFAVEDTGFYSEPHIFEDPCHSHLVSKRLREKYPDYVYKKLKYNIFKIVF